MSVRLFLATTIATTALAPTSFAQDGVQRVEVGTLSCAVDGPASAKSAERAMTCTFAQAGGKPVERFQGAITRMGVEIGDTGKKEMIWTVFAPSNPVTRASLSGAYAAAELQISIGGGANELVGGSAKSIALLPKTKKDEPEANAAPGVAELTLK